MDEKFGWSIAINHNIVKIEIKCIGKLAGFINWHVGAFWYEVKYNRMFVTLHL